jgi:two-component system phosphate regulon sensor histidine kinase PhoR
MTKITKLIIASIIGLLALLVIQGTLIRNTYYLKKESFLNNVNQTISSIDDLTPKIDSINGVWQNKFVKVLDTYNANAISKANTLSKLRILTDAVNPLFISEYNKELALLKLNYNLKFHKVLTSIVVIDSLKRDTIFKANKNIYRLLGEDFNHKGEHRLSNSLWHTDRNGTVIIGGENVKIAYELDFGTEDYIDIDGWERIIFGNMSMLLFLSFLIFTFVFGLLYYSIKSLINQKKIADVKTDFVNNLTHELKTPLATLKLATKLLRNKTDTENREDIIDSVERQNTRLQKLIDQVFNNSLGYREIKLQKENVDILAYLNTLLNDFELSNKNSKILLNRKIKAVGDVIIDEFYLTTALLNILENAVKYSNSPCKINLSAEIKTNLIIKIKDNGIGVLTKDKDLIFDKFYRVGNKEIHDVKGLGLGLYYTKQIIKAHQGEISVESEIDKGTWFTITIPLNFK